MTGERDAGIRDFLAGAGWGGARIAPLAGDASNRRYLRLHRDGAVAVLMDAPPDRGEDVRPFVAMTEWLRAQDLSAPEILAKDPDRGFLLLEDLGDNLYARHLVAHPGHELALYERAVDLLARLAECPVPDRIGSDACAVPVAPYDQAVLDREALLLTDWWMPAATGRETPADLREEYLALIHDATRHVEDSREAMVLRDYHAENLLWLPERPGIAAVGLLDYQDVLAGHAAYDLVSLLEDARRDTSPDLQAAMIDRYLALRPGLDPDAFRHAYAALGAQRNLKIVGIFARLAVRDGKPHYPSLIPRVWAHVTTDLAHPDLAPLRAWVARHVPPPDAATVERVARLARR